MTTQGTLKTKSVTLNGSNGAPNVNMKSDEDGFKLKVANDVTLTSNSVITEIPNMVQIGDKVIGNSIDFDLEFRDDVTEDQYDTWIDSGIELPHDYTFNSFIFDGIAKNKDELPALSNVITFLDITPYDTNTQTSAFLTASKLVDDSSFKVIDNEGADGTPATFSLAYSTDSNINEFPGIPVLLDDSDNSYGITLGMKNTELLSEYGQNTDSNKPLYNGETASLTYTNVSIAGQVVSFDIDVSTEKNYDFLTISKTGESLSGIVRTLRQYTLNVGESITFSFARDLGWTGAWNYVRIGINSIAPLQKTPVIEARIKSEIDSLRFSNFHFHTIGHPLFEGVEVNGLKPKTFEKGSKFQYKARRPELLGSNSKCSITLRQKDM